MQSVGYLGQCNLTDECCIQLFQELHLAHGQYVLTVLHDKNEVLAAISEAEPLRGASARRFKCLADLVFLQSADEGNLILYTMTYHYFKYSTQNNSVDITRRAYEW